MNELRNTLKTRGINTDALTDQQVLDIAKAIGAPIPRKIEVVREIKGGRERLFVQCDSFNWRDSKGAEQSYRGLKLPVDCVEQALSDLENAKRLIKGE